MAQSYLTFPSAYQLFKTKHIIRRIWKGGCVPMKFSSWCYIISSIKAALGFTLMTTADFWCFGTTNHIPSCFFFFFFWLHSKTTQMSKHFSELFYLCHRQLRKPVLLPFLLAFDCRTLHHALEPWHGGII